jgi:hypothetical protein
LSISATTWLTVQYLYNIYILTKWYWTSLRACGSQQTNIYFIIICILYNSIHNWQQTICVCIDTLASRNTVYTGTGDVFDVQDIKIYKLNIQTATHSCRNLISTLSYAEQYITLPHKFWIKICVKYVPIYP